MGLFSKKEAKELMLPYDVVGPQSELDKKFGVFSFIAYGDFNDETLYFIQSFKLSAAAKDEYESIIDKIIKFKAKEIKVNVLFKDGKPISGGISASTLLDVYKDALDLNEKIGGYGDFRDYITYTEELANKISNEYPESDDLIIF